MGRERGGGEGEGKWREEGARPGAPCALIYSCTIKVATLMIIKRV